MRRLFATELHRQMTFNPDIVIVNCDLGYKMFYDIERDYPKRYFNVGAAEFGGMGIAVGLALSGKAVFIYSISTFLIYRAFEMIKLYVDGENIPIKLVGSGRNKDYEHDGPSHDATGIGRAMSVFRNLEQLWPETKEEIPDLLELMIKSPKPQFISLKR